MARLIYFPKGETRMKHVYENFSRKVFSGFNDSYLCYGSLISDTQGESAPDGFYWEFKKGGYKAYCEEICKDWIYIIRSNLANNPIELVVGEYKGLWSPSQYNWRTDRISFEIQCDLRKLKKYCWKENAENFDTFLRKNWSSYDGFISLIPNNLEDFKLRYKLDKNRLIDIMLEFYLLQNVDFQDVEFDVLEENCIRLSDKICLERLSDFTQWDYEWNDTKCEYEPTVQLA